MCKFESSSDTGYRAVARVLKSWIEDLTEEAADATPKQTIVGTQAYEHKGGTNASWW